MFEMIGDVEEADWSADMANASSTPRTVSTLLCPFSVPSVLCKWAADLAHEPSYRSPCGTAVTTISTVVEAVASDSSVERIPTRDQLFFGLRLCSKFYLVHVS